MSSLDDIVKNYIDSLSYVKSIDGFLIKTTTMVYNVEDYCRLAGCDPVETVERVLSDERVKKYLVAFSCYRDNIVSQINSDPRYKKLRRYTSILSSVLGSLECRGEAAHASIAVETPPALWVKEEAEGKASPRRSFEVLPPSTLIESKRNSESIVEKILLGLLVLSIILIILYFLIGSSGG